LLHPSALIESASDSVQSPVLLVLTIQRPISAKRASFLRHVDSPGEKKKVVHGKHQMWGGTLIEGGMECG
jgi:hypothetical protein